MGQALAGRVVLVTGGSRGLGREMVLAFAAVGADVVIASRKVDGCITLAEEVRTKHGRRALPVACNVGDWAQCDELNALSAGLAQTYGPAVRVDTIQCGPFETDIAKAWPDALRAELVRHNALGRVGQPGDILGAALYFATDASAFCTGSTLALDGGWR